MRNLVRAWAAVVLGSAVSIGAAEAAAVSAFKETGGGVVGKLSGSLNLTGLLFGFDGSVTTGSIVPQNADLVTAPGALDVYSGLTGPLTFGAGLLTDATSTSGDAFGVLGATGLLGVPDGYVSGEALSGTTSFAGATLAKSRRRSGHLRFQSAQRQCHGELRANSAARRAAAPDHGAGFSGADPAARLMRPVNAADRPAWRTAGAASAVRAAAAAPPVARPGCRHGGRSTPR